MSGNQMIAMDPEKREDMYYRYKMPALTIKVEGNGNGIKTVFPNIHDVCLAINRPEHFMMKFFQTELGTQRTVFDKDDKFLIMGSHTEERMQAKVYDFIQRFVLCKRCRNPETYCQVLGKDRLSLLCGACGKTSDVLPSERLYSLFTTYYKNHQQKAPEKKKTAVEEVEVAPTAARSSVQKSSLADGREDPVVALIQALKTHSIDTADGEEAIFRTVYDCRAKGSLDSKFMCRLIINSCAKLDEPNFIAQMQKHMSLFRRFCRVGEIIDRKFSMDQAQEVELTKQDETLQKNLLSETEKLCLKVNVAEKMPIIMLMFYEEGVLTENAIKHWHQETPKKGTEIGTKMRTLAKPLVDWLEREEKDRKENEERRKVEY